MHIVLERVPPPSYFDEPSSTMETTYSLVSAIRVSEYSFMFLALNGGTYHITESTVSGYAFDHGVNATSPDSV